MDLSNVAVYVDYENVYKSLRSQHTNVLRISFFEKLKKYVESKRKRIAKIAVYCNFDNEDLYESYHQTLLQSFGVETIHTSNQGKNYSDIKLCVDVLTAMYCNPNIDEFMIVSNDKDMTPLLDTIKTNKKNVSIVTVGNCYNNNLKAFADTHVEFYKAIDNIKIHDPVLKTISKKIWSDFYSHYTSMLDEESKEEFKHQELFYFLNRRSKIYNIMKYEFANILLDLYDSKDILFYKYQYNGDDFIAFMPTDLMKQAISASYINETDIIEDYNLKDVVNSLYQEAEKKEKYKNRQEEKR